jgi:hypothetical protein
MTVLGGNQRGDTTRDVLVNQVRRRITNPAYLTLSECSCSAASRKDGHSENCAISAYFPRNPQTVASVSVMHRCRQQRLIDAIARVWMRP